MFEKKKDPEISPVVEAESLNEELYAALNGADSSEKRPSDGSGSADGESHRSSGSSHHRSSGSSHHRSSGSSHHDSSGSSHHHHHHHHHHSSRSRSEFWQPSDPNKTVRTELSESKVKNRSKKSFGRKTRGLTVLLRVLVVLFAIMAVLVLTFAAIRWSGGRSLSKGEIVSEMITIPDAIKQDVEVKDEGRTVIYKGEKYVYNEDIITILFMGVDRLLESEDGETANEESVIGTNGQADTLVLGVIDKKNEKISFINVSRDTIADIDIYNVNNEFLRSEKRQICLQYAYGDGRETSCEYVVNALQRYLYGMPINAYAAIDYDAIAILNDAVGGVEVNVLEDLSSGRYAELVEGKNVTLFGDMAEYYCRTRDSYSVDANNYRMARQKQYLMAFMQKALELVRADLGISLELYNTAKPYMITDIGVNEVTYLATTVTGYGIETDAIKSIPGEVVLEEDHAAFYADETALYELILNTFYNKA